MGSGMKTTRKIKSWVLGLSLILALGLAGMGGTALAQEVELSLMRTIKQALDPNDILNPGKVL